MFTTFSLAGSLYLVGVGLVLLAKPSLMFSPDGDWKEFGIGQDQERYTPFPFWLFCLVWALVAYFIIVSMEPQIFGPGANALAPLPLAAAAINAYNVPRRNNGSNRKNIVSDSDSDAGVELPKGYYVLNKKATRLSGVPKYVYLGPEEPQE
jgi:hypothetical protein